MTHRKSAEMLAGEAASNYFNKNHPSNFTLLDLFHGGYREGIRACIDELRNGDTIFIKRHEIETPEGWAEWLEKRLLGENV